MSFLQRLRMNNVFNGNMFTPLKDPYDDIVMELQNQQQPINQPAPISNMNMRPAINPAIRPSEGLRFGGVVGDSNPGADILNRAKVHAENLYKSYSEPQVNAGELLHNAGIKPNEQFPGERNAFDIDHQIKQNNLELSKERLKDQQKRTSIAEYKAHNPNLKFIPVKGGNVIAVDQQSGDHFDTGINTGTLSEKEAIEMRGDEARKTQDNKPQPDAKPLDEIRKVASAAQKFQVDYPGWAKYVTVEGNKVTIDHDAINDTKDGKNAYETIRQALYPGNYSQAPSQINDINKPNNTTKPESSNNTVDPNVKIRVKNKATGQTGTISAGAFNPEKYEKIQ